MFKKVSSRFNPGLLEEETLNFWKLRRTFTKCAQKNQGSAEFVYYEYPPCANELPNLDHALGRSYKDAILRYRLMRGYHVTRRGGWSTHGLPVEIGAEKELGLCDKTQIETFGIERFNALCRQSTFRHIQDWERFTDRLGYGLDMQDAFVTHTNEYIESVWWVLKTFWERGLLYQSFKISPYCPRCGISFSDHEAAMISRDTEIPSTCIRLPLVDEPGVSLLVWSDAPWKLLGNAAVAVDPDTDYALIRRGLSEGGSEQLIVSRSAVEHVFEEQSVSVVSTFKGKKLKGKHYQPLFKFLYSDKAAFYVVLQQSPDNVQGTGIRPIAPAFAAEDLQAAIDNDLPIFNPIANDATFVPEVRSWSGMFVRDADPYIIQDLENRGLLFSAHASKGSEPFCKYCGGAIIQCGQNSWNIRISERHTQLAELSRRIQWGQSKSELIHFQQNLENGEDWIVSRARFWGTPLPIWQCETCHHQMAVGSAPELSRLSGQELSGIDLHRPHIDEVHFSCPECQGTMLRVPEVVAEWLDTGALPTAQWHFPSENRSRFREQFPADLVCEAGRQVTVWLETMHAINGMLFDSIAFRAAIQLKHFGDTKDKLISSGKDASKPLRSALESFGADALRWHFYRMPVQEEGPPFLLDLLAETATDFLKKIWDIYTFFVAHANLDQWQPGSETEPDISTEKMFPLDSWLISELHRLARDVTQSLETYDLYRAANLLDAFVCDVADWYMPGSNDRLLSSEREAEKANAYETLYYTLVTLSLLLAPFQPFLSEALYQNLVRSSDQDAPESVHLCSWPGYHEDDIDEVLEADMRLVRQIAALGHAARSQDGIKQSQPLAEAVVNLASEHEIEVLDQFSDLLADVLNVRHVRLVKADHEIDAEAENMPAEDGVLKEIHRITLNTKLDQNLIQEGMAREFARRIQELRKKSDFEMSDPIMITLAATPELWEAVRAHKQFVLDQVQGADITQGQPSPTSSQLEAWFDGQWMKAGLSLYQEPAEESERLE